MAGLNLNHIYKVYPNGVKAVNDFNMQIEDKEFIVFVGSSGCGKSTTLRMIAGLEVITSGELTIDGKVVNDVEPKDRDIAMVFQNYALYPHMTVYENMAFGLKMRKMPKEEIDRREREAADILGISDYLDRKPKAMSGGQRQRVALGRAIVREPKVFLLDEPLSNLDAKLRTSMRSEISKLHKRLQTTFIYVTHDQVEAMTMGTRIVVMKDGFIRQIDTPTNLYRFPEDKFVAGFIGTPQMNFFNVTLKEAGDKVEVRFDGSGDMCLVDKTYFAKSDKNYMDGEKKVVMGIRAEHVSLDTESKQLKTRCRVSYLEELGVDNQVYGDININSEETIADSATKVIFKVSNDTYFRTDEIVEIAFDAGKIHLFDAETEKTIAPRIPASTRVRVAAKDGNLRLFGNIIKLPPAIKLDDGEYDMCIPTEAITAGRDFNAADISEENINGTRLLELDVAGDIIFLPVAENEVCNGINVDLKRCSFMKEGREVVAALPAVCSLTSKFIQEKVEKTAEETEADKNSDKPKKNKKKYTFKYYFEINGVKFPCPAEYADRIVAGGGKDVLKNNLSIHVSLSAARLAESGISGNVEQIFDYGEKRFAKCDVNGEVIFIEVLEDFNAASITFVLQAEEVAVFDIVHGIRYI